MWRRRTTTTTTCTYYVLAALRKSFYKFFFEVPFEKSVGKAEYTKRFDSFHGILFSTVLGVGVDPQHDRWGHCDEYSENICEYHLKCPPWNFLLFPQIQTKH
jgi:hypothetical protein